MKSFKIFSLSTYCNKFCNNKSQISPKFTPELSGRNNLFPQNTRSAHNLQTFEYPTANKMALTRLRQINGVILPILLGRNGHIVT